MAIRNHSQFMKRIKARNKSLAYPNFQQFSKDQYNKVLPLLSCKVNNSCAVLPKPIRNARTDPASRIALLDSNRGHKYSLSLQPKLPSSNTQ